MKLIQQQFWMKDYDILGGGVKTYSYSSYMFSGSQDPNPIYIYAAAQKISNLSHSAYSEQWC